MTSLPLETVVIDSARRQAAVRRIDFIDVAKASGIVLVVAGHAPGASALALTLIYSFHMPLFFFISGYLHATGNAVTTVRESVLKAARSLLVPYVFFFALSFVYWVVTRHVGSRAAKFVNVGIGDALIGLATGLSPDLLVNVTLWFFPCLFVCKVIYTVAQRWMASGALLASFTFLAVVLLATSLPWNARLPWGLDIAWIAIVFYAAGHWLRKVEWLRDRPELTVTQVMALLVLLPCWLALVQLQGRVDLAMANFGPYPLLYLPCAAAGVALVIVIARLCSAGRTLRWLADNSLIVFPLSPLLMNFASGALKLAGLGALAETHVLAWWAVISIWGIAACVPAAHVLRRHVPVLLGLRPPKQRGSR